MNYVAGELLSGSTQSVAFLLAWAVEYATVIFFVLEKLVTELME